MDTPEEQARSADAARILAEQLERNAIAAEKAAKASEAQTALLMKMAQAQGINIDSINKNKTAYDNLYGSTTKQSAAAESNAHSLKVMDEAMANFSKAAGQAGASLGSFTKALLSNEQGFAKYNSTLSAAGDATQSLLKAFGPLGQAAGYLVKGLTMAAEQFTKQADSSLKATDELSKLGGAGSLTASQVLEMGHKAGLSSTNLEVMTKAAGKVGSGMAILGSTVGEGVVAFGKITAVTSEQRQAFQRLGVSQEELMNRQADYIKLQEMSGKSLSKDQAKVKKESLEYAEQLTRLSILTGKSADKIQEEQNAVQLEYEEQLAQRMTQQKIDKLKAEGGEEALAAAKELEAQEKARIDFQKTVTATYGKQKGLEVARVARTGQIDEKTKGLATLGLTVEDVQAGAKKGEAGGAEFNEKLKKASDKFVDNLGEAMSRSSNTEQLATSLGMDKEFLQRTGNLSGRDETKALKDAEAKTKGASSENKEENKAAGGAAATDPAQIARNELTETEIKAKVKLDEVIASYNPLLKGFDATTVAALALAAAAAAATLALGKMAASAAMDKLGLGDGPDKKGKKGKDKTSKARDPKTGRFVKEAVKDAGALSKMAGTAGKVASVAGKFAGPAAGLLAVGSGVMTAYEGSKDVDEKVKSGELTKEQGTVKKSEAVGTGVGQAAGGAAGAWGGAAAGAAIGSVVPVVGTVIGGLLGAAVGGWLGSKGGEVVGEKVGKKVGESLTNKPIVDANGKPAGATDTKTSGTTPASQNAKSESPESIAKGMAAMVEDQKKASTTQEDSMSTLNKTLLETNTALKDLTSKINSVASRRTSTMRTGMPGGMQSAMHASSGGAGGGAGGFTAASDSFSAMAQSSGMSGPFTQQSSSKKTPSVGSGPAISFPSMGSGGTDGGADSKTGTGSVDLPKAGNKGSSVNLDEKAIKDMIIRHEGKVNKPYKDSLGLWTVGVGHLIGDGKSLPDSWNREFSDAEIMKLFDEDYDHHRKAAEKISGFDKFNAAGQGALTDLTFNMGPNWTSRFPNTAKQIAKGNAEGAAAGLQDSKWYTQVGKRAPEVVGLIAQGGGLQAKDGGLADGPIEGYPATLHGNEAILPLNPDSIITKLLNTSEAELTKEMNNNITTTNNTSSSDATAEVIMGLHEMMAEKFDALIEAIEDGNDHTEKLVKFSAV